MYPSKSSYPYVEPTPQYSQTQPPTQYITSNPVMLQPSAIPPPPSVQMMHIYQIPVLGPQPALVVCHNCHSNVLTRLTHKPTTRTHLFALTLCLIGLIPCALLPYFCKSCQTNLLHYCPNCNTFLGTYTN